MLDVVRQGAEEAGRDPATIEVTVPCYATGGDEALAQVTEWQGLGATRILVPAALFGGEFETSLSQYAQDVIGRV